MRAILAAACVVAAGLVVAADEPKKEKPKPAAGVGVGSVLGGLTGGSATGALVGPAVGTLRAEPADGKFVISKPVGTWVRDVPMKGGAVRVLLTVEDERLTLKVEMGGEQEGCIKYESGSFRFTADYSINKESCLYGVIDTFDTDQPLSGDAAKILKFSGQPFCVRFRADDKTLSLKDFKGLGVGTGGEPSDFMNGVLLVVCGAYTPVDPIKPLPALKARKQYSADPLVRQDQLLNQSDRVTSIAGRWWSEQGEQPKPDGGVPYPTPYYLKHTPVYFPPDPAFPLQRERDSMLDPTGEIKRGNSDRPMLPPVPRADEAAPVPPLQQDEVEVVDTQMLIPGTRPGPLSSRGGRIHPNLDLPLPVIPVPHALVRTAAYAGPIPGAVSALQPELKQRELLDLEFDSGPGATYRRYWVEEMPKFMTPERIHGGILRADPPKAEDLRATKSCSWASSSGGRGSLTFALLGQSPSSLKTPPK